MIHKRLRSTIAPVFRAAVILVSAAFLCAVLSGCAVEPPASTPPASTGDAATPPASNTADVPDVSPEDLTYDDAIVISDVEVLYVSARYPQPGIPAIDAFYAEELEKFKTSAESLAQTFRDYGPNNLLHPEGMFYELRDTYEVRSDGDLYSVHRTLYSYTGGAHDYNDDVCDTFLRSNGRRVTLGELFTVTRPEYVEACTRAFEQFVALYGDMLFPDALSYISEDFPESRFCVSGYGLEFYFPAYSIASYVVGTVVIPVSFEYIADIFQIPQA
jgi:hypothetical protein